MSGQNTPGKLHAGEIHEGNPVYIKSDDHVIAEVISVFSHTVDEANARRLVACWNACEGISTENLENNVPVKELAKRYNAVIRQRDQLLTELHKARAALKEQLEVHIQYCTNRVTGLVENDEDRLSIESDQDTLDGIDRVIDQAEGRATA